MLNKLKLVPVMWWFLLVLLPIALFVRFYHITDNQFLFYDEGMYLGYNRGFLNLVAANPPHNIGEFVIILGLMFKSALTTAKSLWFFILNLRAFNLGAEAWYFARLVSAVAGVATVVLVYFWAKRIFSSSRIALLSAVVLSVLPSHVFYSRLGMQESLSAFLFLSAVYLYTHHRRLDWRLCCSAMLMACVFFTNYRMIIAPVLIAFIEICSSVAFKQKINWLRLSIHAAIFYALVFIVGSLDGGVNREVTFGWMFHQAQDASGKFDLLNFLSYPYYVFALEGLVAGYFFWGNLGAVMKRQWQRLLPFGIVIVQMGLFSFAAEKGARYLCVVLPFMAVAMAVVADHLIASSKSTKDRYFKIIFIIIWLAVMILKSMSITFSTTDYARAMTFVLGRDPQAIIVSTQPLVEELYAYHEKQLIPCPKDAVSLAALYDQGARYLIIDPQVYISWTADEQRFTSPLLPFLQIILDKAEPLAEFDHLKSAYLNRFVLDHNEHLRHSLMFLNNKDQHKGHIRVYDLAQALGVLKQEMK